MAGNVDNWRAAVITSASTVREGLARLNEAGLGLIIFLEEDGRLKGIATDGDIRRGLLRDIDLDSPLDSVLVLPSIIATLGMEPSTVLSLLSVNKIRHAPVVDELGKVIGVYEVEALYHDAIVKDESSIFVIMAGGLGQRLKPFTDSCPKPMLEIDGDPMLKIILERAKGQGFKRFAISVNYKAEMIKEFFGDGSQFGVDIMYLEEQSPLGTAGALSLFGSEISRNFVVTNGDVLARVNYREMLRFAEFHGAVGLMAVREHQTKNPFGVVNTSGFELTGFEEKPVYRSMINAGIYVLNRDAVALLEPSLHCDMPTLFSRVKASGMRTLVYPIHEDWLDVGRPEDLQLARTIEFKEKEGLVNE